MAIKDPPDYVAIDPILIYGTHDLPAELYRRLLQLIGWMYVTKNHGKDLGVTIEDLAERWAISERTVYHSLQTLGAEGYISLNYARGRVYVRRGPRITDSTYTPGEPAPQQAARGGDTYNKQNTNNRSREAATHEHNTGATPLHETVQQDEVRATPLHEAPISNVVVDGSDLDPDPEQHQQQTSSSAVQSACTATGLWLDMAAELEADRWVTPARIIGWYEHLSRLQAKGARIGGRPIGSVQALMMANLRAHREPPAQPCEDRHRFVQGEYAEYVQS